ncbi:MAG: hypothetical protein EOP42_01785 [Sphingobacteriaceae bacterium]|nr:MAG: hypothetical protein EOP42_01785 [Sphingobacteriaceae bacterium]
MKKFLLAFVLLAACKTEKKYIFIPGDIVKVQQTRFLILDYNKGRKGFFYKAQDLNHNNIVEYFSQERLYPGDVVARKSALDSVSKQVLLLSPKK